MTTSDQIWTRTNTHTHHTHITHISHTHHTRLSASEPCTYMSYYSVTAPLVMPTQTRTLFLYKHMQIVFIDTVFIHYTRLWFHLQSDSRLSFRREKGSRSAWLGAALRAPSSRVGHRVIIIWVCFVPAPSLFLFLLLSFSPLSLAYDLCAGSDSGTFSAALACGYFRSVTFQVVCSTLLVHFPHSGALKKNKKQGLFSAWNR